METARSRGATTWWVYMVECRGGRIYTGIAKDPDSRYRAHVSGKGAAFTRIHPPRRLLASAPCGSLPDALRAERALRRLSRAAKIAWAGAAGEPRDGVPGLPSTGADRVPNGPSRKGGLPS